MKGITIKLPEELLKRLAAEAKAAGRSIGAIVREKLEARTTTTGGSVYEQAGDLAGILAGGRRSATNARRKFQRR